MLFRADFKSGQPIYLQLISQVKAAAASGALHAGEALPSVGSVAGELRINRNHVARAYSELESLGIIELVPGRGFCMKVQHSPIRREILRTTDRQHSDTKIQKAFRQRMAYSLPGLAITVLYLIVAGVSSLLMMRIGLVKGETMVLTTALAFCGLLLPLRNFMLPRLENAVFPKRQRGRQLLQSLKTEFGSNPDLDSLLLRMVETAADFIGVRPQIIRDHGEILALVNNFPALRTASAPVRAGNDFLMPLCSHDEVIGILRIEGKPGGRKFDPDDGDFLIAVGKLVTMAAGQARARSEKVESEYALEIQRGLLPRDIPQAPGFSIAGAWQPAKNVGGDYYDVFRLNEDEIALIIADVSGKGAPAALLMSNVQATTKAYASSTSSPKEVCQRVNAAICSSITAGRFITFFYSVLNTRRRTLTYCNAGHNPPLTVSQDGTTGKLEVGGTVLGLFAEAEYQEATIQLKANDRLLLFTDGVLEAADSHEREFGDDRLFTAMTAAANTTAGQLRDSIMQAVTHFCHGNFSDDATLLTVVVEAAESNLGARSATSVG